MSYDYQKTEKALKKKHAAKQNLQGNLQKLRMDLSGLQPSESLPAGNAFSQKVKDQTRDYNSNISRFSLLLTMLNTANLIHMNEIELVQWHIINLKMLELGLWSKYNFKERN
jgi:hypothetical protein